MSGKQAPKFHTDDGSLPDLASASDWSCCVGILLQPIRITTQTWVVMFHQYGISALVSQTSPVVASQNVGRFLGRSFFSTVSVNHYALFNTLHSPVSGQFVVKVDLSAYVQRQES